MYVAGENGAEFLGATRQLTGERWLHAKPFAYCGSIGPLKLSAPFRTALNELGQTLARGCMLRGLFGVDCIVRNDVPIPVEVNPRYTASVEVLEHAGISAFSMHRRIFEAGEELVSLPQRPGVHGKAIFFAREALIFPSNGPWLVSLKKPFDPGELLAFADLPHAGERIEAGQPVLTFFASVSSVADCENQLRQIAADLDHWLLGR